MLLNGTKSEYFGTNFINWDELVTSKHVNQTLASTSKSFKTETRSKFKISKFCRIVHQSLLTKPKFDPVYACAKVQV